MTRRALDRPPFALLLLSTEIPAAAGFPLPDFLSFRWIKIFYPQMGAEGNKMKPLAAAFRAAYSVFREERF